MAVVLLAELFPTGLRLVICGTAAGRRSAACGQYYADARNSFWRTLAEVGLTPRVLRPAEAAELWRWGIGLTDLVRTQAGVDADIDFGEVASAALRAAVVARAPTALCFNGKTAARLFLACRSVEYGWVAERVGRTRLFVAPSTSGQARRWWQPHWWADLAIALPAQASGAVVERS